MKIHGLGVCFATSSHFILIFLILNSLFPDSTHGDQKLSDERIRKINKTHEQFDNEITNHTKLYLEALQSELCDCNNVTEQTLIDSSQSTLTGRSDYKRKGIRYHPSPIPDVSDECKNLLDKFSSSVSNFTYCTLTSARPITVCEDCMDYYLEVQNWFSNISSSSGDDCGSQLFNKDFLLIIQTNYKFVTNFWELAECDNCYSKENLDKPTLCNFTVGFFQRLDYYVHCINSTQIKLAEASQEKNMSVICESCRKAYLDLNAFYEEMNTQYNNRLCYDVIDAMNVTRHAWSSTYMCNRVDILGLPVLLLSGAICFLPILYYTGNRLITHARESKLVMQKRMSFVQTSYSSTSHQR